MTIVAFKFFKIIGGRVPQVRSVNKETIRIKLILITLS